MRTPQPLRFWYTLLVLYLFLHTYISPLKGYPPALHVASFVVLGSAICCMVTSPGQGLSYLPLHLF